MARPGDPPKGVPPAAPEAGDDRDSRLAAALRRNLRLRRRQRDARQDSPAGDRTPCGGRQRGGDDDG